VRSLSLPRGFGLIARPMLGFRAPRQPILGTELAGDVVAVGKAVSSFKIGDAVLAFPGGRMGAHAEYVCLPANGAVVLKPAILSYEQAAALSFGGATMLDFFGRASVRAGEHVLVNGASGTVGTAAIQLAKHLGARVTGVCSTANRDLVQSIGADHVIDYTQQDFTRSGDTYDVIVDAAGTAPFARSAPSLARGGRLLLVIATLADMLRAPWQTMTSDKKVIAGPAAERVEYLQQLAKLATAGAFLPVIDRVFPFERMVEAHRYVDLGHKQGSVVIVLSPARG
jgi:NADPH:quinone reductase-like Zn-dependent oxidoreductase